MCMYSISAKDIEKYIKSNAQLVDLREVKEYQISHIPTAINIPYDELDENIEKLNKNNIIIFYCDRGNAGMLASIRLNNKGYRVINVVGGFNAYRGNVSSSLTNVKK